MASGRLGIAPGFGSWIERKGKYFDASSYAPWLRSTCCAASRHRILHTLFLQTTPMQNRFRITVRLRAAFKHQFAGRLKGD